MIFWITFGLFGFVCVPLILMFALGGADKPCKIGGSIVVIIFWLVISFGAWSDANNNAKNWNNGFCECGTHWELSAVSEYRGSTTKYYTCPNCHKEIEIKN
jgi:hypothetical protein